MMERPSRLGPRSLLLLAAVLAPTWSPADSPPDASTVCAWVEEARCELGSATPEEGGGSAASTRACVELAALPPGSCEDSSPEPAWQRLRDLLETDLDPLLEAKAGDESEPAIPQPCRSFLLCSRQQARIASRGWRPEFDRICGQTDSASGLEALEIESLIVEAATLLQWLESSQEPSSKVFRFRLRQCRSFFEYALELARAENL